MEIGSSFWVRGVNLASANQLFFAHPILRSGSRNFSHTEIQFVARPNLEQTLPQIWVLYEMRREDVACPVCTSAWWDMDLFDLLNGVYDEQRGFAKKRLCLKKCVGDDWPVQIGDFLGVHRSSLVVTLWCQNVDGTKVWQLLSLHQNLSIGHYCCYLEWKTGASLYGQLYFRTITGTN